MKKQFKHVCGGIKGFFVVSFTFLLFPFARLFLWRKRIWIVSEYGYEARDNGYSFFSYIRKNHKDINCYFAITRDSPDYEKVAKLGNIIKFGSFKHFAYYCGAKYLISSKTQGFCPSYYLSLLRKKIHLWGKYIFLQHGITKDNQVFLHKKNAKIDLFICGAKPEYEDIKKNYGYAENEVAYTGFARFDSYFDYKLNNYILVMPTWRRYTIKTNFENSTYYLTWSNFINSKELSELLNHHNIKICFYLHPHYKDYAHYFKSKFQNVTILPFDECDIQTLILQSKMFITDFSSLAFDFAYMKKPVIYYQYDEDDYFNGHYIKGYFDYRRDGFGPVCNDLDAVLDCLKKIINNDFIDDQRYLNNRNVFFPLCDNNNSERIFEAICNIK